MARFWFKSDRERGRCTGSGCSTVYAPPGQTRTKPRGKASLGRVCYRDGVESATRWEATVGGATGYGRTKSDAVRDAIGNTEPDVALYTLREVRELTGIPIRTMRDWITAGYLTNQGPTGTALVSCCDIQNVAAQVIGSKHSERSRICPCDANAGT